MFVAPGRAMRSEVPHQFSGRQLAWIGVDVEFAANLLRKFPLRGVGILYRSVLLPLSNDATDHVLGAANYRSLNADEALMRQIIFRTQWL